MKDIIKEISKWTSIMISVLMFAVACSDDKEDGAPEEPAPAAPTITDFVPPHGVPGVTITITGTGLKEANEVTIGGKQVELTGEATDTEIKVVTTEEVTGGKIKVTTPYGTVETVSEFVVDAVFQTPSLTVVPQDNVSYWDIITLEGENLDIVEKVFFGTVEARIIREDEATRAVEGASVTELKVEVPYYDTTDAVNIFLEYTNEDNELVKMDTQKSFTVTPRAPKLDAVSSIDADFFEQISLTGTDLHLVEKVIFGTAEAAIDKENSNSTVLKVTVPYYEEEDAVTITLVYRYGAEDNVAEGRKSESADKFAAKKIQPENVECPVSMILGNAFDITGKNLDKIEKVLFNETEITATLSDDKTKLICSLPDAVTEASTGNTISIEYWKGNATDVLRDDFEIKVLPYYVWKNVTLYGPDNENANFFSGTTGQYYTPCEFAANKENIHLSVVGGAQGLQIASLYSNGTLKFKCEGTALAAEGMSLRFRKLKETVEADRKYIDMIKNGTLENINVTQATADGLAMSPLKQVIRHKLDDATVSDTDSSLYNETSDEGITIGGINMVMVMDKESQKKVQQIGFVELVSVTRDSAADSKGSMTVNFYFQKDVAQSVQ